MVLNKEYLQFHSLVPNIMISIDSGGLFPLSKEENFQKFKLPKVQTC